MKRYDTGKDCINCYEARSVNKKDLYCKLRDKMCNRTQAKNCVGWRILPKNRRV